MYRIAVVDDEAEVRELLKAYFARYEKEKQQALQVVCYEDGAQLLDDDIRELDLVFLDIEMKGLDGLSTARELRQTNRDVGIVFVTNLAHYALSGYEVNALDFIVKPLNYEKFVYKLDKSLHVRSLFRREKYTMLQIDGRFFRIALSDIFYIQAEGSYVVYYTAGGPYRTRGPLKTIEADLCKENFLRCDHGCLVNLRHVIGLKNDMVTVGSTELKISRSRKKPFLEGLTMYLGRKV